MLWGAFNNASTAMQVFTTDLGSISQNIANVNTTGYKRQEMMFSTMMSEHRATPTSYLNGLNIFGVQATQRNLIEAQGVIMPSTTWSDLAINGKGFFMVAPPSATGGTTTTTGGGAGVTNVPTTASTDDPSSVLYTRAGAWHRAYGTDTDPTLARSYFLNSEGCYLLGWMADDTGAVPDGATLEPVYTLAPRPIANNGTAAVSDSSTLTPSSITMPGRATTTADILANLPRESRIGGSKSTVTITDPAAAQQDLQLNWQRTGAYTYTVTASNPNVALATSSWDVTVDDTGLVTSPAALQNVAATWTSPAGTNTVNVDLSTPPNRGEIHSIPVKVYDENYTEHTLNLRFERYGTNQWYMMADGGVGATAAPTPSTVQLEFDDTGQLISPANGQVSETASWTTGTPSVTGSATVTLDLSKLSQYDDGKLYIGNVSTDGYGRGTLLSTTFNDKGELSGYYDNGRSRVLFKVPVANFVADNSLEAVSGTMFRRTAAAGDITVSAIEDSVGEARFATSSLEGSTVDIEEEFTRMIMTQKAYSMNSQVFKTADEMTTTARDIKA